MSEEAEHRRGAWRAALACMVTLAVALGIGRFAFTPMLPVMLAEGKLDLQGGGLLASLNYLGYFVGALSCAAIRLPPIVMVRGGLIATALLLLGMGLLNDFAAWGVLRLSLGGAPLVNPEPERAPIASGPRFHPCPVSKPRDLAARFACSSKSEVRKL